MDQSLLAKPIYKGFDAIVGSDYQFKSLGQVLPIAKDGWRILVVGTTRESSKLTIKANGLHITGVSNIGTFIDVAESQWTFTGDFLTMENFRCNVERDGSIATQGGYTTLNNINLNLGENVREYSTSYAFYNSGNYMKVTNFHYKQLNPQTNAGSYNYGVIRNEGSYCAFSNCTFNAGNSPVGTVGLLYLGYNSMVTNSTFYMTQPYNSSTSLQASNYCNINNCQFYGSGSNGATAITAGAYNDISNNYITNTVRGISLSNHYNTVVGNNITCIDSGNCIYQFQDHTTITGNYFQGGGSSAVLVKSTSSTTNSVISGNSFKTGGTGINISNYQYLNINGNNFNSVTTAINATAKIINITNNAGASEATEKISAVFKNTSGGSLAEGDAVVLKAVAANDEVTTTTSASDTKVVGIALGAITNNSTGYICTKGTCTAKVNGTADIAIGDFLTTYTSAGILAKATAGQTAIAIALAAYTADDSSGTISVRVIPPRVV